MWLYIEYISYLAEDMRYRACFKNIKITYVKSRGILGDTQRSTSALSTGWGTVIAYKISTLIEHPNPFLKYNKDV